MNKVFKMTLFKKIFLVIFCLFSGIEVFHIYRNYHENLNQQMQYEYLRTTQTVRDEIIVNDLFNENMKDIQSDKFLNDFQNYTNSLIEGNSMILDKNYREINKGDYWREDKKTSRILGFINGDKSYYIDFTRLDNEVLEDIEKTLVYNAKSNQESYLMLESDFQKNLKTHTISIDNLKYLNINGTDIIGETSKSVKKYQVYSYYSHYYEIEFHNGNYSYFVDKKEVMEQMLNHISSYGEGQAIIDDHICAARISPLGEEGYLVIYSINYHGVSDYKTRIMNENLGFYILLLAMITIASWCISYVLTSRIKRINQVTEEIAHNHFQIKLKETPKDELGHLSKNINIMSDNLNKTIQQLNEEIKHVKELENFRKDFINQFTHEMKTPLGIINGYSELIEEAENEKDVEKYLNIINRETTKINQLIQSMLNLSRLEAGKVELNLETFDLEDLITEIIDEYEVLLMQKNIKIEVITKNKELYADKKLISTVIHNFLSNAIKHTPQYHKIRIVIDKTFKVYNEGNPIDEDMLERIWHTFVTHDQEGSGLGLAICRSVLDIHGFKYWVKNTDRGVCFIVDMHTGKE